MAAIYTEKREGYKPCRACGSTRAIATVVPGTERESVIVVCAGCENRRGYYTRKGASKAQREREAFAERVAEAEAEREGGRRMARTETRIEAQS